MSRLTIPPELKRITQFIRRAEELDHDKRPQSRIVAYYCRQYAVQQGIQLSNTPASRTCLSTILSSLEKEKKAMSAFTPEESHEICKQFALEVFEKADNQDRSGNATKATAKTFYAAAAFLKILDHFGEQADSADVTEKWNYARWKAMEINKAINEGREVVPGGFGEMDALNAINNEVRAESIKADGGDASSVVSSNKVDVGGNNTAEEGTEVDILLGPPMPPPTGLPIPKARTNDDVSSISQPSDLPPPLLSVTPPPPPPSYETVTSSPPKSPPKSPSRSNGFLSSAMNVISSKQTNGKSTSAQEALDDALELTRFALAALEAKDTDLGRMRLEQALKSLKSNSSPSKSLSFFKKKPNSSSHDVIFMTKSAIASLQKRDMSIGKDRIKQALAALDS